MLQSRGTARRWVVALLTCVLIGGTFTAMTPAGAQVAEAVATNWKKIWKKKLQPLADKRYYKKTQSDAKYQTKAGTLALLGNYFTKAETDAKLGNYYTKAQSDANYYTKAQSDTNYYTKAQADARYAPFPTVIRGAYGVIEDVPAAGSSLATEISFGVSLSAPPTVHLIPVGGLPPAGCSGTLTAPNADPGHLCIFQRFASNVSSVSVCNVDNSCPGASPFGAWIIPFSAAAGHVEALGSWAVRPAALAPPGATFSGGGKSSSGRAGVH